MKKFLVLILCLVSIMTTTACGPEDNASSSADTKDLQILFINIGDGDSILISAADKNYLIDTGREQSFPRLIQALRSRGVDSLEAVFITHTHGDHTGGLSGLLSLFQVQNIYGAEITTNKKNSSNVLDEIAQAAGKSVKRLKAGDAIVPDEARPQLAFTVLGPLTFNAEDDNDNSLVLNLHAGSFSCLLAGDMQFAEEKTLLDAKKIAPCTVLKVGNHGNADASSPEFISAASPQYAVISTDSAADTDTPAPSVLAELDKAKAKVFVTQDYKTGILLRFKEGQPVFEDFSANLSPSPADIKIDSLDKKNELLTLRNEGSKAADLSGWWAVSERGGEMFFFPQGTSVAPRGRLSVASGKNPAQADLIWEDKNVWHDKKTDTVVLFDQNGFEKARLEK